jgi:hypothetical protein
MPEDVITSLEENLSGPCTGPDDPGLQAIDRLAGGLEHLKRFLPGDAGPPARRTPSRHRGTSIHANAAM